MAFIKRHPALSYFALTFAVSWGGMLVVIGPTGIPGTPGQLEELLPMAILALLAGPSLCGLLLTAFANGRAGLSGLLSRLRAWRVGAGSWAVALLTAPLVMTTILLALSQASTSFLPALVTSTDKTSVLRFGIVVGLSAGVFEELGWTGFAIPALRRRYGVFSTGLIVGLLWAAWHELPAIWMSGVVSGPLALTSYALDPFLFLVGFRVLMVFVYERTESLLVAMLMHTSLTASARILGAPAIAGVPLITFDLIWAAVLWAGVGMVAALNAGHSAKAFSRAGFTHTKHEARLE